MSSDDKIYFEAGRPVQTSNALKSRWDFAPSAERMRELSLYPIYTSGSMDSMLADYHSRAYNHGLSRAKAYLRKLKMSSDDKTGVTIDFPRKV